MLESLIEWDKELFLLLNHFRADWMDPIMIFLSAKKVWIPLYLILFGSIIYLHRKWSFIFILGLLIAVGVADRVTSGFMKPHFARYRPCHEPSLADHVITPSKCGGKYGFASSHAANTFAVGVFFFLFFKRSKRYGIPLLLWATLISYSRIYLGVHYPLDVLVGALVGMTSAVIFYLLSRKIYNRITSRVT